MPGPVRRCCCSTPGPGSARQLTPLIATLGASLHVTAPNIPGNGDSDPLDLVQPEIADYAAALQPLLDAPGIAWAEV